MESRYHTQPRASTDSNFSERKAAISFVEIASKYLPLKRSGKEYVCLCPFHSEKTPSFTVNEDKGLFHCFGCGEGGDVIKFIQKIEGLDFKGALAHLGLASQVSAPPNHKEFLKRQRMREISARLAAWANQVSQRIAARMRDAGQRMNLLQQALKETERYPFVDTGSEEILREEIERCEREWSILQVMHDDFVNPNLLMELWVARAMLVKILPPGESCLADEIAGMFPPITEGYRKYLRSLAEMTRESKQISA